MGAHNILFWMSVAAGVAAICLWAMLKAARGPPPEDARIHEPENTPPDHL